MHAANACMDGRMRYECTLGADIDAKVDAITKLQAEFEAGTEVSLPSTPPYARACVWRARVVVCTPT